MESFLWEKWDSLGQQLFLEDSALTQLGSGRCLRFRMGRSRQPWNSWVQPSCNSPQWLMLHSFVMQDTQIHAPLCLLCKKEMSHSTHRLLIPLGCRLIRRVFLSLLWKCLILLLAETNPTIIAIINWKEELFSLCVCSKLVKTTFFFYYLASCLLDWINSWPNAGGNFCLPVWRKPANADQKHKSWEGSAGSAHALLGTIKSAIIEEHHNNLIVWMGMTSVWQGLHGQDQNSVASLLNTETVEKLQATKAKALETEAAGDSSA